jgi:hypothetical protein
MALPSHLVIIPFVTIPTYLYPISFQIVKLVSVYHSLPEYYYALATIIYVGYIFYLVDFC